MALVTDAAEANSVSKRLKDAYTVATTERGLFSRSNALPAKTTTVKMTMGRVPCGVSLSTNASHDTMAQELAEGGGGSMDDDVEWIPHRAVATPLAGMYGMEVEVKVRQ